MEVYAFGLGSRPIKERARATSIHISSKAPKTEAGPKSEEMECRPDCQNNTWRWKDRQDGFKQMPGGSNEPERQRVGELLKSPVMAITGPVLRVPSMRSPRENRLVTPIVFPIISARCGGYLVLFSTIKC